MDSAITCRSKVAIKSFEVNMMVDTPNIFFERRMFGSINRQSLRQLFCSGNPQVEMSENHKAFTLVELLMVIVIIAVMLVLSIPAFYAIKGGSDITKAAYDISGVLEQARTYAMANNTYVWVGFYEEDGSVLSTNPATPGT